MKSERRGRKIERKRTRAFRLLAFILIASTRNTLTDDFIILSRARREYTLPAILLYTGRGGVSIKGPRDQWNDQSEQWTDTSIREYL